MSNNNNSKINSSKINNKKKSFDPTIGDAVKEAIETHKEVKIAGPAEVGDVEEIEKNAINKNNEPKVADNETNIIIDETMLTLEIAGTNGLNGYIIGIPGYILFYSEEGPL